MEDITISIDKLNSDITSAYDNVKMLNKQTYSMIEFDPSIRKIIQDYNCGIGNKKANKMLDVINTAMKNLDIFLYILGKDNSNNKKGKIDRDWNGKLVGFVNQYQECIDVLLDETVYIKHRLDNINHIYIEKKKILNLQTNIKSISFK